MPVLRGSGQGGCFATFFFSDASRWMDGQIECMARGPVSLSMVFLSGPLAHITTTHTASMACLRHDGHGEGVS